MRERIIKASLVLGAVAVAACGDAQDAAEPVTAETTVVSDALRFEGRAVGIASSGHIIRERAILRGVVFDWQREVTNRVATEEDVRSAKEVDLTTLSESQLAEAIRGIALYEGHEFREAELPLERARDLKRYWTLEAEGADRSLLDAIIPPGRNGEVGTAPGVEFESADDAPPQHAIIHGVNDLSPMNNMVHPHRTHIVFDNVGSTSSINGSHGSGTLIGRSTAMSVAHVFWDETNNTWESDHQWAPGYDSADTDPSPWGQWYRCYWVTIPNAYISSESSTHDYAVVDFNVGCNSVRNGVNSDRPGATVGWLGNYTASTSEIEGRRAYLRGYPASGSTCDNPGVSCAVRVWGDHSNGSENDISGSQIRHQADSLGGHSGSGFYQYYDPSCAGCGYGAYVIGMHRAGASSWNLARRYDGTVRSFMLAYSDDY